MFRQNIQLFDDILKKNEISYENDDTFRKIVSSSNHEIEWKWRLYTMIYEYRFVVKSYCRVRLTRFVLNERAIFDQMQNVRTKSINRRLQIKRNFVKTQTDSESQRDFKKRMSWSYVMIINDDIAIVIIAVAAAAVAAAAVADNDDDNEILIVKMKWFWRILILHNKYYCTKFNFSYENNEC